MTDKKDILSAAMDAVDAIPEEGVFEVLPETMHGLDLARAGVAPEAICMLGDNPIVHDVAIIHMHGLDLVRADVARVMFKEGKKPHDVSPMAISVLSVGTGLADQLVVFSPGGDARRNTVEMLARLKAITKHVEHVILENKFS